MEFVTQMAENMSDEIPDEQDLKDHEVFDTSKAEVGYSRSRDTQRVTMVIRDPTGISEMKLYLILCLELEKLERRLGISEAKDGLQ